MLTCPSMQLTLVLPGFLLPAPAFADSVFDLPLPALAHLLARGRRRPWQGPTFARLFGLAQWPEAALRRHGRGLNAGGHWLCLDPIAFELRRDGVFLQDPARLALTTAESAALQEAVAPLFARWGRLATSAAGHWELALSCPLLFATQPLPERIGQAMPVEYPPGEQARAFRHALAEAQMVLHAHPVNRARDAAGLPLAASLWPWGEGALPEPFTPPFETVMGDDPALIGLARLLGMALSPPAAHFSSWRGRTLIVLDALASPARALDAHAWRATLTALERDWFIPIEKAWRQGRIDRLELFVSDGGNRTGFHLVLRARDRWRFWRRNHPLAELFA